MGSHVLRYIAFCILLAVPFRGVNAAVITFDGLALNVDDPVLVDGFSFDYIDRNGWAILADGFRADDVDNGSDNIVILDTLDGDATIRMTSASGDTFSAQSFDMANFFNVSAEGRTIEVTGFLHGGGQVQQSFLTGSNVFTPAALSPTFAGLDALEFHGFGAITTSGGFQLGEGFQLDNITVNAAAVPEPGSAALLIIALAGLGLGRRKLRN